MPRQTVVIIVMDKSNWNYPLAVDALCAKGISPDEVILLKRHNVIAELQSSLQVIVTHRIAVDLTLLISKQKAKRNRLHVIVYTPGSLLISHCIYAAAATFTSKDSLWEWVDDNERMRLRRHPVPRYRTGLSLVHPGNQNLTPCPEQNNENQRKFFESLNERHQQTLRLMVSGKTNAGIAEALHIAPGSAKQYVHAVYDAFRDFLMDLGVIIEHIERQLIAFFSDFFKRWDLNQGT